MQNLVDSHAHLDLLDDPESAIAACRETGVRRIIAVGIDLPSSRLAVEYTARYEEVQAAVGIHPHYALTADEQAISEIATLAENSPKVVAIGETGLDYFRDRSPREAQLVTFIKQIALARRTSLPLIIHSREADDDILEILDKYADGLTVILHCFSLFSHVDACSQRGYYMSIAGNVTFAKATGLRKAVARIPDDLLLTETDSPYLTPVPHRGQPNTPANVRYVLEELAHLRGANPDELTNQIDYNFTSAFSPKSRN